MGLITNRIQILSCVFCVVFNILFSQDIEPRRWGNIPLGTKVLGAGYAYTYGEVLFDPLLETQDVSVRVHNFLATYVQPFKLGKNLARLDVLIPFSSAYWEGLLSGEPASADRTGFADPRLRFSYHIAGPPAMDPKELQQYLAEHYKYTTVGVSLSINLPLGEYFDDKLLNLGLNQFVFRPQIGLVHNWGLWSYEFSTSVLIYTDNNDFFNDGEKKQDPLFAAQTHLIKRFPSRHWLSASLAYGLGGQSIVNRQPNNDVRANLLAAVNFGIPLGKKQSLKLSYIRIETLKDIGTDSNSLLLAWSVLF